MSTDSVQPPFGPSDFEDTSNRDFNDYFDRDNLPFRLVSNGGNPLVGRSGAGKSVMLRGIDDGDMICVYLRASDIFGGIRRILRNLEHDISTETSAELWELFCWVATLECLYTKGHFRKHKGPILDFYNGVSSGSLFYGEKLVELLAPGVSSLSSKIEELAFNEVTYEQARQLTLRRLKRSGKRVCVALDFREQFPPYQSSEDQLAVRGLLTLPRLIAERECADFWDFRYTLPGESYHVVRNLPHVPPVAFNRRALLQWHPIEVLRLCLIRFRSYLRVRNPTLHDQVCDLSLSQASAIREFWLTIFPKTVKNLQGVEEDSLTYVLRHTQMAPRQVIIHLNSCCRNIDFRESNFRVVKNNEIVLAIKAGEPIMLDSIILAHNARYPMLRKALEATISHLPLSFEEGVLEQVHANKLKGDTGLDELQSYEGYKRALVEAGLLGQEEGEDKVYKVARFEYAVEHILSIRPNAKLCLHPLVSQVYGAQAQVHDKFVRPLEAKLECEEYRPFSDDL